jgi:uncharacterized membrane protein YhaH (DUF805 family)
MAGRASLPLLRRLRRTPAGALIARAFAYEPRFTGRARRSELALVVIVCLSAFLVVGPIVALFDRTPFAVLNLLGLAALTGIPVLAAIVRRLHDTNRHGRAILIAFFPYLGLLILGFYLILEGAEGDNVFGPNPRT